jgi:hypothetical protein
LQGNQVIREIIRRIKELDFGAILDDIGALKMPLNGTASPWGAAASLEGRW